MYGISSSGKESIDFAVSKMFDRLAYKLLGKIPKLQNKNHYLFDILGVLTLAGIFIQALGNKEPNHFERDVIKSILNSSYGHIESLKNKTSSNVVEAVDALVKEAKLKNTHVNAAQVSEAISKEMEKARSQMKLIAEAETTKTRNMGHTMEIAEKANKQGIEDPNVFFVVVRDGLLCSECKRLHMLSDGVTPKVYKMSQLSMGWHKRGDDKPSACGEHPFCRCSLTQLPPGWGFKGGFVSFIALNYDEYAIQRGLT
jgi:rubrerythrin